LINTLSTKQKNNNNTHQSFSNLINIYLLSLCLLTLYFGTGSLSHVLICILYKSFTPPPTPRTPLPPQISGPGLLEE
jgi:hypothetical protein